MKFKNESDFTRWLSGCLKKCNTTVLVLAGSMRQTDGIPDRFFAHFPNLPLGGLFVEVKYNGGKLSAAQKRTIGRLMESGCNVTVLEVFEEPEKGRIELRLGKKHIYVYCDEIGNKSTPCGKIGVRLRNYLNGYWTHGQIS